MAFYNNNPYYQSAMPSYNTAPIYQNEGMNPQLQYPNQTPNYYYQPTRTQPQTQNQQLYFLNGQMVDSIEAVKAKDVDMSGNPTFYPNINGDEIYKKQLQADGTCPIIVYKRMTEQPTMTPEVATQANFNQALNQLQTTIMKELEELKQTINSRSQYKGGKKYEPNDATNANV